MAETSAATGAAVPGAKPPKLKVENLSVAYLARTGEPVPAVQDVSFEIQDKPGVGEIVVFLGPSGCGKSTILKCLAGLLTPTQGRLELDGKPVSGTSRDRGMVFQAYTSFAWLTVLENVEYGLKLAGVEAGERKTRALEALTQVGLEEYAARYPKELSGGQKQRVAIARTMVNKPSLLLMDEPFGALDPNTRWGMQSLMLDISRKVDNTILFVTHDVSEAVYIADTVFVLSSRPARLLHRVDVPVFAERDLALKQTPKFREIESQLLAMLHGEQGHVRVG
jgi:NitT/TauT family transport system ATP-binding protein